MRFLPAVSALSLVAALAVALSAIGSRVNTGFPDHSIQCGEQQ
jgi:hypothetical protein